MKTELLISLKRLLKSERTILNGGQVSLSSA